MQPLQARQSREKGAPVHTDLPLHLLMAVSGVVRAHIYQTRDAANFRGHVTSDGDRTTGEVCRRLGHQASVLRVEARGYTWGYTRGNTWGYTRGYKRGYTRGQAVCQFRVWGLELRVQGKGLGFAIQSLGSRV